MVKLPYFAPESDVLEVSVERAVLSEIRTNLSCSEEVDYGEF